MGFRSQDTHHCISDTGHCAGNRVCKYCLCTWKYGHRGQRPKCGQHHLGRSRRCCETRRGTKGVPRNSRWIWTYFMCVFWICSKTGGAQGTHDCSQSGLSFIRKTTLSKKSWFHSLAGKTDFPSVENLFFYFTCEAHSMRIPYLAKEGAAYLHSGYGDETSLALKICRLVRSLVYRHIPFFFLLITSTKFYWLW